MTQQYFLTAFTDVLKMRVLAFDSFGAVPCGTGLPRSCRLIDRQSRSFHAMNKKKRTTA